MLNVLSPICHLNRFLHSYKTHHLIFTMYVKYVVGAINMLYILYNLISCICFRNKVLLLLILKKNMLNNLHCFNLNLNLNFWCLTPLSAIFQLYHGDQF